MTEYKYYPAFPYSVLAQLLQNMPCSARQCHPPTWPAISWQGVATRVTETVATVNVSPLMLEISAYVLQYNTCILYRYNESHIRKIISLIKDSK